MKYLFCFVVVVVIVIFVVVLVIGGCLIEGDVGKVFDIVVMVFNGDVVMLFKQVIDVMCKVIGMYVRFVVIGDVLNLWVIKFEGDIFNILQMVVIGSVILFVGNKSEDVKFVYVDGYLYFDLGQFGIYIDFGNGVLIYNVLVFFDFNKGLVNLLVNFKDVLVVGSQQVDGVVIIKIIGNLFVDDIVMLVGLCLIFEDVKMVFIIVWIVLDGFLYLVQIQIVFIKDMLVMLMMFDWGKQVIVIKLVQLLF